jgi:cytochrome P450
VSAPPTIDLLSASTFVNGHPHELFAWMRENDPVHWHPEPERSGFWAVVKHADIRFVNMRDDLFSHAPSSMLEDDGEYMEGAPMVNVDPPRHTLIRKAALKEFLPRAVRERLPALQDIAAVLVDEVIEAGSCDLVVDLAGKMASDVTANLLEIPREDAMALYHDIEITLAGLDVHGMDELVAAVGRLDAYGRTVMEARRANPGDDLLSRLANEPIGEAPLTDADFLANFMLMVAGAGDTTRHLIAGGMLALFENPDQRQILTSNQDKLLPIAVEEMLRWVTPVVYNRRMAKVDCSIGDAAIKAGDKLAVYYASGNRDADVFDAPNTFDVTRSPNPHVAFSGVGAHFCLGAHLARAEATAMLSEILTRLPDIEQTEPVEIDPSTFVSGPRRLMVRYTPGSKAGPRPAE